MLSKRNPTKLKSNNPISPQLMAPIMITINDTILNVFKIMILAGCDDYARIMMLTMGFLKIMVRKSPFM